MDLDAQSSFRSIGNERIDRILRGTVGIFEIAFPGRIRACYVDGSHADSTSVVTSDLDTTIIFKDAFRDHAEQQGAVQLGEYCARLSSVELDIEVTDEAKLAEGATPMLKLASHLIYGEDIRDDLPLLPIEVWTRDRMHSAYWLLVKAFSRPGTVVFPLGYPDTEGEFYGYDCRTVTLPDGTEVKSTRNLIRVTGWMATALIALQARQYVARKRECHVAYQKWIGDDWTTLLEEIYERCRGQWAYLIPEEREARTVLRQICRRTLGFENHFLARYKDFLLDELRSADGAARELAAWLQMQIPYDDQEVLTVLQRLSGASGEILAPTSGN